MLINLYYQQYKFTKIYQGGGTFWKFFVPGGIFYCEVSNFCKMMHPRPFCAIT